MPTYEYDTAPDEPVTTNPLLGPCGFPSYVYGPTVGTVIDDDVHIPDTPLVTGLPLKVSVVQLHGTVIISETLVDIKTKTPTTDGLNPRNVTDVNAIHAENAFRSILVTSAGIVMDVKILQLLNAFLPILASCGTAVNVTDVKTLQKLNAYSPILVTSAGIVIDVKRIQLSNALFPMLVTAVGIVIDVKELQPLNALSPMLVT